MAAGETYEMCAERELAEELGVADVALAPLGSGRWDDVDSREISRIFLTVSDGPFEFADGEVDRSPCGSSWRRCCR